MKKTKRFDEGGETVYAEDLPEDYSEKMYSSTINRQAPVASKPAAKSASKPVNRASSEDKAAATAALGKNLAEERASVGEGFKRQETEQNVKSREMKANMKREEAAAKASHDKEWTKTQNNFDAKRGPPPPGFGVWNRATRLKSGGSVSSASKRADGIATKGKTRGTMVMCGGGMMKGKK
jgi:hypothetical protein